ncbi:Zinc finger BED domain-containing protein 5 [Acipenser ruthenus]|uniref:Zinc finger BED domain-containing protein 5 n=1 Tax=Acipenser ruthenus TaxID=7906 RepID=A0A444U3A0_ACIRT|nr:Zinc finger BED domain-containing protein 5 [Acipenser ruthenus]
MATAFALQLDESIDVSGEAELIAFIRYMDSTSADTEEHILFCKSLKAKATGEEIFNLINDFFSEHSLSWNSLKYVCSDGATAMTGRVNGVIARFRKENPSVQWLHCVIHREALASKKRSTELHEVLNDAIKIINFIIALCGFIKKTEFWKTKCGEGNFSCFPQLDAYLCDGEIKRAKIKTIVEGHLA